jgi:phage repressor protein C with HTH and peptisase S24 domain
MMDPEISAIDAAMKQQGKSKADLGRLLGLDSAQVSRMFSGKRRLQLHEAKAIHSWLGGEQKAVDIGGTVTPMPGMVPLYGWVGAASDSRLTMAEQNLRGYVPMHPNQAHVRNAFALEVADVSMTPRYEPGEIIYCAPNRWPGRGQDCVLVTNEGEGLLKRFIRRDVETLTLHQLNPDEDLHYPMETVFAVHTVVGRG